MEEDYMKQFVDNFINGLHQLAKEDEKIADEPLNGEYITQYKDWLAVGNVREEIVRCWDCVHCGYDDSKYAGIGCMKFGFGSSRSNEVFDGFCAWGIRKGGDA